MAVSQAVRPNTVENKVFKLIKRLWSWSAYLCFARAKLFSVKRGTNGGTKRLPFFFFFSFFPAVATDIPTSQAYQKLFQFYWFFIIIIIIIITSINFRLDSCIHRLSHWNYSMWTQLAKSFMQLKIKILKKTIRVSHQYQLYSYKIIIIILKWSNHPQISRREWPNHPHSFWPFGVG
jgi:hypothetical protein